MKKIPDLPILESVTLDGYTLNLQYYLGQEYAEISEAVVELPTIIEWLNCQLQAQIESKYRRNAELDRAEAKSYFRLKEGGFQRDGYGDKSTEQALKYAVQLDQDVTRLRDDIAVLAGWVERLSNLMKSFQFRLELVRSSEATRRKQLEDH